MRTFVLSMAVAVAAFLFSPLMSTVVYAGQTESCSMTVGSDRHRPDNRKHGRPGADSRRDASARKEAAKLLHKADDCRRKAADYRRKARSWMRKAESYHVEARRYARYHQFARARSAQKNAEKANRKHDEYMRKAVAQDRKAADYERRARRLRR